MNAYGDLTANDTIRFERMLPGPIERVWAHLVEPEKRRLWLADGPMTLAPGGEVALRFRNAELSRDDDRAPERYRSQENTGEVHGRILVCEPPQRLAFTWGDDPSRPDDAQSEVDIELNTEGERVRLVLTHRRLPARELISVAGGWHTHLGILEDHLSGQPPRPFWRTHTRLEAEYVERLRREV
jgi:uncharacterized protein YndB with AHSA1/START domain